MEKGQKIKQKMGETPKQFAARQDLIDMGKVINLTSGKSSPVTFVGYGSNNGIIKQNEGETDKAFEERLDYIDMGKVIPSIPSKNSPTNFSGYGSHFKVPNGKISASPVAVAGLSSAAPSPAPVLKG
jgi:UDP-N-acetylenolpyruvoylglucosamine reductase